MASKVVVCAGCRGAITTRHFLTCSSCAQVYDLECANVSETRFFGTLVNEKRLTWRCPGCISKQPKTDNTNTPVGAAQSSAARGKVNPCQISPTFSGSSSEADNVNILRGVAGVDAGRAPDRSFMDDSYYLDNMRTVVRDEFERIVENRMSILIAKVVAEQTEKATLSLHNAIAKLNERVATLEAQLKPPRGNLVISNELREPRSIVASQVIRTHETDQSFQFPSVAQAQPAPDNTDVMKMARPVPSSAKPLPLSQPLPSESAVLRSGEIEGSQWSSAATKKKRRPSAPAGVMRGAAAPGATKLEAADRRRLLHLYYVKVGTTDDQVCDHLNSLVEDNTYKVVPLKARGNYASFKLDVPSRLADAIMSPANWAQDICIKPWRQSFRPKTKDDQKQD